MPAQKRKLSAKLESFRKHLDTIVAILVALGTLGGTLAAAGSWIISEVSAQSNQRIDQLQNDMKAQQQKQEQATTRIELMQLMAHDPENVVEIELLARKYFIDLSGDTYMTGVYSSWSKQHGGDTSFVVYH